MARIMIIAGGTWQCPIIKLAKSKGHFVVCSNLYENSIGFEYADVGVVANVLDKEKNLEIAREYEIDAVLTDQTDIAVQTVAYVAEKMGIKGIGLDVASRFTNKYLMREFTSKAGFPSPNYELCYSKKTAKDFLHKNSVCIIKPIDSQSSRGIHIVKTDKDIDEYFDDCLQYSNADNAILVEEYIDGTEFTVDGLKTPTGYEVTAISEKSHYEYNPSVANRLLFTQNNSKFDYDKLRTVNEKMVLAMGLPFGLTHAEYKYRDGEFYLIEIAARGGGTKISSDIVPLVSGINTNEVVIDILTDTYDGIKKTKRNECAVLGFFDFKPGKVIKIEGIEEARKLPGVCDLNLEVSVGDHLGEAKDDRSRCGYYILCADSVKELESKEQLLKERVKVVTE